jgi:hypothetical protein
VGKFIASSLLFFHRASFQPLNLACPVKFLSRLSKRSGDPAIGTKRSGDPDPSGWNAVEIPLSGPCSIHEVRSEIYPVGSENRTGTYLTGAVQYCFSIINFTPLNTASRSAEGGFNRGDNHQSLWPGRFNILSIFNSFVLQYSIPTRPPLTPSHMGKIAMIDFLRCVVYIDIYRYYEEGVGYGINSKNISKRSIASG